MKQFGVVLLCLVLSAAASGRNPRGQVAPNTPGETLTILSQSSVAGISGNLFIHGATGTAPSGQTAGNPPQGTLGAISEQSNPAVSGGWFQGNNWAASAKTGFTPASPAVAQLSYAASGTSTTVQWEGSTFGVYLQSSDRPLDPTNSKMMITPEMDLPDTGPAVFVGAGNILTSAVQLQIPTATGNPCYVNSDHIFTGPGGILVTFSVGIFSNGNATTAIATSQDTRTGSYILSVPLGAAGDSAYLTPISGAYTGTPWSGFQPFSWSTSYAQFAAALQALQTAFPSAFPTSAFIDPSQYVLTDIHMNAEFHFNPGAATLGWSMQGWSITLYSSRDTLKRSAVR